MVRALAGASALAAWGSLALQLSLIVPEMGWAAGLWRFFGYFTILTNLGVAVVATAMVLGVRRGPAGPKARLVMAAGIAFVGIAYWALLARNWSPQGWQLAADIGLHTLVPLLFVAIWWGARDGSLGKRDALAAMAWPVGYAVYALARGAGDGWYAYWFLDPAAQGWGGTAASIALLAAVFAALAWLLVRLDRAVASK